VADDATALRLMLYDETCRGVGRRPLGLSHCWKAGGWLYRRLGRLDGCRGLCSWSEALDWLLAVEPERPIGEIQYWGHGKWGLARIGEQPLDAAALRPAHPLHDRLAGLRQRLLPDGRSLWWFRTCETFGAETGQRFARAWSDFFGCRTAGHTYIIAYHQSGLHSLSPGCLPGWPADEGLARGSPAAPEEARWSHRGAPNTITCLHGRIPAGF